MATLPLRKKERTVRVITRGENPALTVYHHSVETINIHYCVLSKKKFEHHFNFEQIFNRDPANVWYYSQTHE